MGGGGEAGCASLALGGFIPLKSGHKPTRGGFKGSFIPHLEMVLCLGLGGKGIGFVFLKAHTACATPTQHCALTGICFRTDQLFHIPTIAFFIVTRQHQLVLSECQWENSHQQSALTACYPLAVTHQSLPLIALRLQQAPLNDRVAVHLQPPSACLFIHLPPLPCQRYLHTTWHGDTCSPPQQDPGGPRGELHGWTPSQKRCIVLCRLQLRSGGAVSSNPELTPVVQRFVQQHLVLMVCCKRGSHSCSRSTTTLWSLLGHTLARVCGLAPPSPLNSTSFNPQKSFVCQLIPRRLAHFCGRPGA